MGRVALEGVTKRFGDVTAVRDLTLDVQDEEFLVLLGPSGCGKSTALRMIAGLEEPNEGKIWIGDELVNEVEPKDRNIAMVFQSYALYPHMTVERNIEFPLKSRNVKKEERARLVSEAATALGLDELLNRKPAQLSGGQRQRVALARAIVRRPAAFLMDEPLSNLDAKLRVQTRAELIALQRRLATTVVYVTHDQVEAMTMGHRIAIMNLGELQQIGPPQEVYEKPANLFVAGFIGNPPMNTISAKVTQAGADTAVAIGGTPAVLPAPLAAAINEAGLTQVVVGVRPEHLHFASDGVIPATVMLVESLGHERHVVCQLAGGATVIVRQPSSEAPPAEDAAVTLDAEHGTFHVFDATTGQRVSTV
jgi:multiple sugar transport system ATP-binding protein